MQKHLNKKSMKQKVTYSKADKYFALTVNEILEKGKWDENPRPKWTDTNSPAHSKYISQKTFTYDISKGELPLISFRKTAIKGGFYDIEAIYIKQTNIIEEMHPSIHSWWEDFVVSESEGKRSIGQTYGHTVRRYKLVDKLLDGLLNNPFGRRHIINLWQEQQMIEDPKALVPCAYETLYTVRDEVVNGEKVRFLDMTLNQRSMDYAMTVSINPMQYVMLGMMICGHLNKNSKINHQLGIFEHKIQNCHLYDRHLPVIRNLIRTRQPIPNFNPKVYLKENKNFCEYTINDFVIECPTVQDLNERLPLAV